MPDKIETLKADFKQLDDTSSDTSFDDLSISNEVIHKKDKDDKMKEKRNESTDKKKEILKENTKSSENGIKADKSKKKTNSDSWVNKYKKLLNTAGVNRKKSAEFFKEGQSEKQQKSNILNYLEEIGVKKPINLTTCAKYKKKQDLLKEVEELDADTYITTDDSKRATRRNSVPIVVPVENSSEEESEEVEVDECVF